MSHNWQDVWTLAQYPLLCMAVILAGSITTYIIVSVRKRLEEPASPVVSSETFYCMAERLRLIEQANAGLKATVDANLKLVTEAHEVKERLRVQKELADNFETALNKANAELFDARQDNQVILRESVARLTELSLEREKVKDLQNSVQKLLDESPDEDDLGGDLMSAVIRRDPHYGAKPARKWCFVCGCADCGCLKDPHAVFEGGLPLPKRPPEPFN